jgi:hypothetical protein
MEGFEVQSLTEEQREERFKILQYKVFELQIEKVWTEFEKAGFKPILIKGWAAAQLYPQPWSRHFVDIDLIVPPDLFAEAEKFLPSIKSNISIDLHKGARHLDSLHFEKLLAKTISKPCGSTEIRLLCPEDHLRVLCVHWLNDGGSHREKLWDIYYAVANRSADFDWDRFLNSVNDKRRKWLVCAVGLAHKYLGLNIEDTPLSTEAKKLPRWLVKAVEKEWRSEVRLLPLHYFLRDKKMLWKQIKKRIPPNAVQATIELEGEFNNAPRFVYQVGDIFIRLMPSIKRINRIFRFRH